MRMTVDEFRGTLCEENPPPGIEMPLAALWWDAKGQWACAHGLVDSLESHEGMAVHAYLHRKEGVDWNADYWYRRTGRKLYRVNLEEEWETLVEWLGAADVPHKK